MALEAKERENAQAKARANAAKARANANAQAKARANALAKANANALGASPNFKWLNANAPPNSQIANATAIIAPNPALNYIRKKVSKFNSAMVNAAQGPITGVNYATNPPGSNAYLPPPAMNYRPAVGNPSLVGLVAGAAALSAGSGGAQATAYPSIAPR
jgi:hypothetical protein